MNQSLVLFPNIILDKPYKLWGFKFIGLNLLLYKDVKEPSVLIKIEYENSVKENKVMRQLEVLYCNFMVAAYLIGEDPKTSCKMIKLNGDRDKLKEIVPQQRLLLSTITDRLPKKIEESEITICWFAHYLEQDKDDEHGRAIRLYNALGTLPSGFEGIITGTEEKEISRVLVKLLLRVEDFKAKYDEDESYTCKSTPLTCEEIDVVERYYLSQLFKYYPCFK